MAKKKDKLKFIIDDNNENNEHFSMGQIAITPEMMQREPSRNALPILPTRNFVLFPGVALPISLSREMSAKIAEAAVATGELIGVVCQLSPETENPRIPEDLFQYGVVADVLKIFDLPDGSKTAFVKARGKFKIMGKGENNENSGLDFCARIRLIPESEPMQDTAPEEYQRYTLMAHEAVERTLKLMEKVPDAPSDLVFNLKQINDPAIAIGYICSFLPIDNEKKFELLKISSITRRAEALLKAISSFEEILTLRESIIEKTRQNMDTNQRNAFLQQQMESIREELYGDENDEISELVNKALNAHMPDKVAAIFHKEVDKLRRLNPQTPDYSVQYSYLETLVQLPWTKETEMKSDYKESKEILDADHFGLKKVKERILEQLAILIHNPEGKSPILCLVGPPGVGKTSLGKSVARALGRNFQRVSLGGLHDEAEIRGHRRTYIGAMPGRIIDAIKRAGSSNPVIMLDEIDKVGKDYKGDPEAALLEVLDPEQNKFFHDNYIDLDYDLSHVLFIATANTLSTIQQPLIDRMEVIELSGYLLEEKLEIARRHILPRVIKEHRLEPEDLVVTEEALTEIIENYTSESGVRQLEKALAAVARKAVLAKVNPEANFPVPVRSEDLYSLLGLKKYVKDKYEGNDFPGVVTGLAWTSVGGEILLAETSLAEVSKGKGGKLTLTGNLGDVMKESATIALQWVKAHHDQMGISCEMLEDNDVHIHFPEGAIAKDGPSAGITIATSIVSAFTRRKVRPKLAMTGEITLRGKVLPVGGIKEKILAAKRAGITEIVISSQNKNDVEDIPEIYRRGLNFHYVNTVDDVMSIALERQK